MRARKGFLRRCCTNSTRAQTMKKSYQRGSTVPFRCCRLGYRTFTGLPDSPPGLPTRILSGSARSPGDWLTSLTPHEQSVQSLQGVNNGLLVAGVRSFVSDRAQRKLGESRSHPPQLATLGRCVFGLRARSMRIVAFWRLGAGGRVQAANCFQPIATPDVASRLRRHVLRGTRPPLQGKRTGHRGQKTARILEQHPPRQFHAPTCSERPPSGQNRYPGSSSCRIL
jgi:hypothetical protein